MATSMTACFDRCLARNANYDHYDHYDHYDRYLSQWLGCRWMPIVAVEARRGCWPVVAGVLPMCCR